MRSKTALSKKDLTVVLVSVLMVMVNIGAVNNTARKRAKEMVCLSNLRQWGTMFEMFTNEHNGYFNTGYTSGAVGASGLWMNTLRPYYENNLTLLLCPEAIRPGNIPSTFTAWRRDDFYSPSQSNVGSYGINSWLNNNTTIISYTQQYWRNVRGIEGKNKIPVLLDSTWYRALPREIDQPPLYDGELVMTGSYNEMKKFCINRHNGGVNGLFMDWSARKIGLKELWTFQWYRNYITWGPWTRAGGVRPEDWPQWMRNFKEY
jgi:prepilin-type processing-associated H-X9-DG protein